MGEKKRTTGSMNSQLQNIKNCHAIDIGQISDGYHTFDELYAHRIALYIVLCRELAHNPIRHTSHPVWRSLAHSDGLVWAGWFILGIGKEKGKQITYHLPVQDWDNCWFATELDKAPEWDGHTSADVLTRLLNL